jgi:hypothetical protein
LVCRTTAASQLKMQNEKARPPAGFHFAFFLFHWLRLALRPRGKPLLLAVLLLALAARAAVVTLTWNANPEPVDNYRVFIGPNPRHYTTNFVSLTNGFTYELPAPGRYWFAVRAERQLDNLTNAAISALSDEVTCELLPTLNLASVPHVRLTVAAQSSGDLLTWTNQTFPPLWFPATNPAQFWRNPSLQISRENAAWPGLTTATN